MCEHLKTMGETGAGITSEDQINMDEDNEFLNKWSESHLQVLLHHVLTSF
jgi:hypothetical protein